MSPYRIVDIDKVCVRHLSDGTTALVQDRVARQLLRSEVMNALYLIETHLKEWQNARIVDLMSDYHPHLMDGTPFDVWFRGWCDTWGPGPDGLDRIAAAGGPAYEEIEDSIAKGRIGGWLDADMPPGTGILRSRVASRLGDYDEALGFAVVDAIADEFDPEAFAIPIRDDIVMTPDYAAIRATGGAVDVNVRGVVNNRLGDVGNWDSVMTSIDDSLDEFLSGA